MAKNLNYTPWNEFRHIETRRREEDWDDYLINLSKSVGAACDKFFEKRGMKTQIYLNSSWTKKPTLSGHGSTEKAT